jgi:magnesium transporter
MTNHITVRHYHDGSLVEKGFDPASVSDILAGEETARIWLDIMDPTDADLELVQEEFGLHPLSIEDAKNKGQRPKVETFQDYFFVVMHGLSLGPDDELADSEIHVFTGKRFLVTLRYSPVFEMAAVKERWDRQPDLTDEGGAFLLYALLDEVVDAYFPVVDRFEDLTDDIETRIFSDTPDADLQEDIFKLKHRVVEFRRLVMPLREVVDLVQEQPGFVTERLGPYFRDISDHVIRTLEFVDNVREMLTAALEAKLSQDANRLNQVMKKITSWGAILLVPTLIAGIYGMNFNNMPELRWGLGYPGALGLMLVASTVLYTVFKKKDWL